MFLPFTGDVSASSRQHSNEFIGAIRIHTKKKNSRDERTPGRAVSLRRSQTLPARPGCESEHDEISDRTKKALKAAKKKGVVPGRYGKDIFSKRNIRKSNSFIVQKAATFINDSDSTVPVIKRFLS